MPPGRPRKYADAKEFEKKVEEYFEYCKNRIIKKQVVQKGQIIEVPTPWPASMAGLAWWLNIDRRTLNNYKETDDFFPIIKRARQRIEDENIALATVGCHDARIAGLNLASNFGYATKTEANIKSKSLEDALRAIHNQE